MTRYLPAYPYFRAMGNRHHYVPRFYLAEFASAAGRTNLFNFARQRSIRDVGIRDQCHAHRLYTTDAVERGLSHIEGAAATVFRQIRHERQVPALGTFEHDVVLGFLALQLTRTIAAMENAQEMHAAMTKAAFGSSPPKGFENNPDEALALSMAAAPAMAESLEDLALTLIVTTGENRFLTSDHPVFRYNLYCEGIEFQGVTGTTARGFQLILPISPNHTLMLYDGGIYKVGTRKTASLVTATSEDAWQLNKCQAVSAHQNLYFADWQAARRLPELARSCKRLRDKRKPRIHVAKEIGNSRSELLHQYWPMPQLGLRLSFLSIQKRARSTDPTDRANRYRPRYQRAPDHVSGRERAFVVDRRRQ